jgi:osmoprotectant transport system substrate-binding protein
MRQSRMLALGASVLALVSACSTGGSGASPSAVASIAPPPTAQATVAPTVAASVAPPASVAASVAPSAEATTSTPSSAPSASAAGEKPTVRIGSDGFYEAKLMAEIYAQTLEAGGYTVDRAGIGIGTRAVSAAALDSAQFDLKPEYIGSGLAFYAKADPTCGGTPAASGSPAAAASESAAPAASESAAPAASGSAAPAASGCSPTGDPAANASALQALLKTKGITVLSFSPAADQNAFVVRPDTASQFNLSKMSDTAAVQDKIKWGLATDCATNPLCGAPGGALQTLYGLTQTTIDNATPLSACDQPMVDALKAKTIDLGELCSTQPDIAANKWVLLQDDKNSQPADNLAPLVRDDLLAKVDMTSFEKILNDVSTKMDTATLTKLNGQIVFDKKDIKDVAEGWLKDNGFHQ